MILSSFFVLSALLIFDHEGILIPPLLLRILFNSAFRAMQDHSSFSSASSSSSTARLKSQYDAGLSRILKAINRVLRSRATATKSTHSEKAIGPRTSSFQMSRWRPRTLSPLVLTSTILVTAAFVVLLGILQKRSDDNGGILFAEQISDLSFGRNFSYQYLPTVLAILFSFCWSWIDLDVKRLEPWFQVSGSDGASASKSLLLQYPLEFVAFVPIHAAKRKQWTVLSASTIMVLVFWAVTPLQSGIFAIREVHKTRDIPLAVSGGLLPIPKQADFLDDSFLNTAYGILWLGQTAPSFTTRSFALAPFTSVDPYPSIGDNKTWSSETMLYTTDLSCRPADVTRKSVQTLFFDDVRNCTTREFAMNVNLVSSSSKTMFLTNYIGSFNETFSNDTKRGTCDDKESEFLAVWMIPGQGSQFLDSAIITALLCEPSYYTQKVFATVALPDYSVLSTTPLSPKSKLTDETFDRSRFESILNTGDVPATSTNITSFQDALQDRRDISGISIVDQSSELLNRSILVPAANMVGFAVASTQFASKDYLDPTKLQEGFRAAHQALFALAAHNIMQPPPNQGASSRGVESYKVASVALVRTFTYLVEAFLIIILGATCFLLYSSWNRPLALDFDPDSISRLMCLCRRSPEALGLFKLLDHSRAGISGDSMKELSFKLQERDADSKCFLDVTGRACPVDSVTGPGIQESKSFSSKTTLSEINHTVRPHELNPLIGLVFLWLMGGSFATIVYLKIRISRENGIPLPSNTTIAQQILLNYLPTALGSVLEPIWIVINRLICLTQPFDELKKRSTRASRSLSLRYASLPPQLIVFRALRARHFLLAFLCFISFLANVLTISLSGLFYIQDTVQSKAVNLTQNLLPELQPASLFSAPSGQFGAPLQTQISNISTNTSLPAWTTQDYFLIPAELPPLTDETNSTTYSLETFGIGARLVCTQLIENDAVFGYEFELNNDATQATFSVNYTGQDGQVSRCYDQNGETDESDDTDPENTQLFILGSSNGTRATELFAGATAPFNNPSKAEKDICPNLILAGWVRSAIVLQTQTSKTDNGLTANVSSSTLNKTFMACEPSVIGGIFNVDVDRTGLVLKHSMKKAVGGPLMGNMSEITTATMFQLQPVNRGGFLYWHNDSFASDWVNYFIKELTRSPAILDPKSPVPEFESASKLVNDVYQRLFAITMSQNTDFLLRSPKAKLISALSNTKELRVFMSQAMFIISVSILSLDILAALAVYGYRSKAYLTRMPTSIASIIAYFAASHILNDLHGNDLAEDMKTIQQLEHSGQRYGFGRYMGTDGRIHTGIESAPFVAVPTRQNSGSSSLRLLRRLTQRGKADV